MRYALHHRTSEISHSRALASALCQSRHVLNGGPFVPWAWSSHAVSSLLAAKWWMNERASRNRHTNGITLVGSV